MGEQIGETVGYQIGMDKQCDSARTRLLFVTTGTIKNTGSTD